MSEPTDRVAEGEPLVDPTTLYPDMRVPNVTGRDVNTARWRLKIIGWDEGWEVVVKKRPTTLEPPGRVLQQWPRAGHRLAEGRRVVLLVSKGPVPPPPPCDPSYPTLCIRPGVADLDRDQVGATNFVVKPPDPHGFDGYDNDGRGCE